MKCELHIETGNKIFIAPIETGNKIFIVPIGTGNKIFIVPIGTGNKIFIVPIGTGNKIFIVPIGTGNKIFIGPIGTGNKILIVPSSYPEHWYSALVLSLHLKSQDYLQPLRLLLMSQLWKLIASNYMAEMINFVVCCGGRQLLRIDVLFSF